MSMFPRMAEIIPAGRIGVAEISHYTVTKLDVLREAVHGGPCEEGTVAILRVAGRMMMSDTRHEHITNSDAWLKAQGNVLIAGLGIGMLLHGILAKKQFAWRKFTPISKITVIEKEADVIALVRPTLPPDPRIEIVHADIFDWKPENGALYDCLYFDIWADGSTDLAKMERRRLGQKFRQYKAPNAWMGYWKPMERR